MRAGAGLVTLGIPKGINSPLIKVKPKVVMTFPLAQTKQGSLSVAAYQEIKSFSKKADLLIIGPGLGQEKSTVALVRKLVGSIRKPIVIDADGLNALADFFCHCEESRPFVKRAGRRSDLILTPHHGEMARLLGVSVKKIQADRKGIAKKFAKQHKVTLVLKGHNTVVTDYKGNLYVNKTGNPGMATAGSGDVLAGMIGAFLAQGLDAFSAAKYAVYLHGLAGDIAAKEKSQISLLASDITAKIPEAVKRSF